MKTKKLVQLILIVFLLAGNSALDYRLYIEFGWNFIEHMVIGFLLFMPSILLLLNFIDDLNKEVKKE